MTEAIKIDSAAIGQKPVRASQPFGKLLYCLVTEAHGCEQLALSRYAAMPRPAFVNSYPQPFFLYTLRYHATHFVAKVSLESSCSGLLLFKSFTENYSGVVFLEYHTLENHRFYYHKKCKSLCRMEYFFGHLIMLQLVLSCWCRIYVLKHCSKR